MLSTIPPHPVPPLFPTEPSQRAPIQPPMVYVPPVWEYKHLTRKLGADALPGEEELNTLGNDGWELAAVIPEANQVHLYFKRQRE